MSVIVPARNEAATIAIVVRSVLETSYSPFELLVVDDRSSDRTAAIVESLPPDPRLRLVRGEELPEGWYGKPWACLQGFRHARGDLLLFTDADTRHHPALLGQAVGALEQENAALVTVSPTQKCVTFWERLVMPQIWFLLALRYHPQTVNRARRASDVIANGQFILTSRTAYEIAGTHAAVRHEVAEDLALAQTYLAKGLKLHFAFAERLMETRMYQDLAHLIEGWSKNIYLGGRRSFPDEPLRRALVPMMLVLAMLFWLAPPAVVIAVAVDPALGRFAPPALAATGLSALFWMLICYGMKIPVLYGLGYPMGALMALYVILKSTWRGGRRVEWKGRVYEDKT
ncbi:MAG TPA: glycosyltransferase [Gemmatimonadales bacterium]|nr:glycosyltransferase [Gemmatimonadales bacterium]